MTFRINCSLLTFQSGLVKDVFKGGFGQCLRRNVAIVAACDFIRESMKDEKDGEQVEVSYRILFESNIIPITVK